MLRLLRLRQFRTLKLSAFGGYRDGFGVGDRAMRIIVRLRKLGQIDLRLTKVTDRGMADLARWKSLRRTGIEGTVVTEIVAWRMMACQNCGIQPHLNFCISTVRRSPQPV